MLVGDQQVMEPGFAVGDIAIGDPAVADFRVRPGRRAVLLIAKGPGRTKLILWDQRGHARHEYDIVVETAEQAQAESKLRTLLRDFPSVKVERIGDGLVVTGSVSSRRRRGADPADGRVDGRGVLRALRGAGGSPRRAACRHVDGVRPLLRRRRPRRPPPRPAFRPLRQRRRQPPRWSAPAEAVTTVEYEVQLLEASVAFGSGSYETGIEPSGRMLHTTRVRAPLGGEVQAFIPAKVLASKDIKVPAFGDERRRHPRHALAGGARRPATLDEGADRNQRAGEVQRVRAGWLAPRAVAVRQRDHGAVQHRWRGPARHPRIVERRRLAGEDHPDRRDDREPARRLVACRVPSTPSAGSYVPYYNKERKTQLLLLMRARVVAGRE